MNLTLKEFYRILDKLPIEDYIVALKYKYNHEKEFSYSNQILEWDCDDYVWLNDWDEGYTSNGEVYVIGFVAVDELDIEGMCGNVSSN